MKTKIALASLLLFICICQAFSWDGERKGFLLGVEVGTGYDTFGGIEYDSLGIGKKSNGTIALAFSPRIGYAFNNRLALMYARNPLTFPVKNDDGKNVQITVCTESLQLLYFMEDSSPSVYFGAGAGVGYFFDEDTFDEPAMNYSPNSLKGIGVYGILGFEPIRHVTTELAVHVRSPQYGAYDLAVSLLIGVLGY